MKKKIMICLLASSMVGGLSGCALLNTGEENFSCTGMPDSVFCRSARDVYEATNNGKVPTPTEVLTNNGSESGSSLERQAKTKSENEAESAEKGDELIANYVTPALPDKPVPIRTPAQVMRIWIAAYVDKNGDLIAPGYIYTEIEPRRWLIQNTDDLRPNSRVFTPLRNDSEISIAEEADTRPGYNSLERFKEETRALNK